MESKKDYVIWAPTYSKSGGVRVLYRLAELLQEKGYNAYVFAPKTSKKANYIEEISDSMRKNAIVVYPEIVVGNPLCFQNVVRWVLYFPGLNGGESEYDDYELKFAYLEEYYSGVDLLYVDFLDRDLFYKDDTVKDIDSYFVYKGGQSRELSGQEKMVKITGKWPQERKELAALLRRTRILYSFDDHTMLMEEARLCGCDVKIVRSNGYEDYISKVDRLSVNAMQQLDTFIAKTQVMHYDGPIRSVERVSFFELLKSSCKVLFYKFIYRHPERLNKWILRKTVLNISRRKD